MSWLRLMNDACVVDMAKVMTLVAAHTAVDWEVYVNRIHVGQYIKV